MTVVLSRRSSWVDAGLVGLALIDAWFSTAHSSGGALALSVLAGLGLSARRRHPYLVFALTLPALFSAYVLVAPLTAGRASASPEAGRGRTDSAAAAMEPLASSAGSSEPQAASARASVSSARRGLAVRKVCMRGAGERGQ